MRRKHNDDRYFKCELESESERESEIAGRRVASKARSEPSERERERRSDSPPTPESERERETTATGARRDGARTEGRFAEASGLRSSRKSFLSGRRCTERELRVTSAGQQHARRDRGQHQHRTRYCVVCSCCEQPLHQELINLRGYRWL